MNQPDCVSNIQTSEDPVSSATLRLTNCHILTRQSDLITKSDQECGAALSSYCCCGKEKYIWKINCNMDMTVMFIVSVRISSPLVSKVQQKVANKTWLPQLEDE